MINHKSWLFILGSIILLFLCLLFEIILRLFWYPPILDPHYKRNDTMWLKNNVQLDRFGYRDRNFEIKKDPQTLRIYSLGTSYTFGWYINNMEDSYPKQLEKNLRNKFSSSRIEVINASHPGFGLPEKIERFKIQGFLFSPDLVTIDITIDDLMDGVKGPQLSSNQFIKSLKLYQFIIGNFERENYKKRKEQEIISSFRAGSTQIKRLDNYIKQLKEETSRYGSKIVMIALPEFDPSNPNEEYKYERFNQIVKELSDKNSVMLIDLLEPFSKYPNKQDLMLNPIDPHPSVVAHKIIGEYIMKSFDFNKILSEPRVIFQTKSIEVINGQNITDLNNIFNITSSDWVYFDQKFGLGSMNLFLSTVENKKVFYIEDTLKTVKAFTHESWIGGKIEYNVYPQNNNLIVPRNLYGFKVAGISGLTAYWDENGSRVSETLDFNQLKISRNNKDINILILKPNQYNLIKITVDIAVKQFDLDNTTIVSMFSTQFKNIDLSIANKAEIKLLVDGKIGPLPQFQGSASSTGYIWLNDELKPVALIKLNNGISIKSRDLWNKGDKLELPIAQELKETDSPSIEYIF